MYLSKIPSKYLESCSAKKFSYILNGLGEGSLVCDLACLWGHFLTNWSDLAKILSVWDFP